MDNDATTETVQSVSLYYRDQRSDKVYRAWIDPVEGGYAVNIAYGRRGSALTTGTKTKTPVEHGAAVKILDKLVAAKKASGYTEGQDGTPYQHSEKAGQVSGLRPQLLHRQPLQRLVDAAVAWRAEMAATFSAREARA
jgi:bifunctional non-homologous end joining protein LigD